MPWRRCEPGGALSIWLTFIPGAVGRVEGELLIHVEGQTAPALRIPVSGNGLVAQASHGGCGCDGSGGASWMALQALVFAAWVRRRRR